MYRKDKEKRQAIELRKEGGSIREISRVLAVSKGSVSTWVRGVPLSDKQKEKLQQGNPARARHANLCMQRKYRDIREHARREGREEASRNNPDHIKFCMLFFAEGAKNKNSFKMCNTCVEMLQFMTYFLVSYFKVSVDRIGIEVQFYTNNGMSVDQIKDFWLKRLGLTSVRRLLDKGGYYSGSGSGKYPYGVCTLVVGDTYLVQRLFGSIEAYLSLEMSDRGVVVQR